MDQALRDKKAFELAREFLLKSDSVTPEVLEGELKPQHDHPPSLNDVYLRLLISAQNTGQASGVIGKSIGGIDKLASLLYDFDPHSVVKKYQRWEPVLDDIEATLKPRGKIRRTSRSLWPRFCRTIVTGARFLAQFKDADEFRGWVEFFDRDDRARPALPMLLRYEVHGLGFSLACDFLKEIGYTDFGKPDVHVKKIFQSLELSSSEDSYEVFKAIVRVARNVGTEPFVVDKVFWLVGGGRFVRSGLQIGRQRDDFIAYARKRLG